MKDNSFAKKKNNYSMSDKISLVKHSRYLVIISAVLFFLSAGRRTTSILSLYHQNHSELSSSLSRQIN